MPPEYGAAVSCEEIAAEIRQELSAAGLRVVQSFDLRSARALLPDCACPHHGTAPCNCQYSVLLIYGQSGVPETLIVHGHGARCWLVLADNPHRGPASHLASDIVRALAAARLITPVSCAEDR